MALEREISILTGLPAQPLTDDAKLYVELVKVYNAIRILASAIDKHTGEPLTLIAGEQILYGQTVGISTIDGKAYLADDAVLGCIGFCNSLGTTAIGEALSVQIFGMYPTLPAGTLTAGERYYQTATPGTIGLGPAAQVIGFAISDTQLYFMPDLGY